MQQLTSHVAVTRARRVILHLGFLSLLPMAMASVMARPIHEFSAVASSAEQSPSIDMDDASNARLSLELDRGRSPESIARVLHWSLANVHAHTDALMAAQLLRQDDHGTYAPTFLTADRADAARFHAIDEPLVTRLVAAIRRRQPQLQERFMQALHIDAQQARALSLFALGDVPFDRWQVRNVRKEFLPGYPPARAGKSFYLLASEDEAGPVAAFGFYSHAEQRHGDVLVATFGCVRNADPFGAGPARVLDARLAAYLAFVQGRAPASTPLRRAGLVRAGKPTLLVVSQRDYAALPAIADEFRDELLQLLMADRPKIETAWKASRYAHRVSFQEFALWWYHFLYADVIDALIRDGTIAVPDTGYATLVVRPDDASGGASGEPSKA
jgi:hypothetical protein